MRNLNTVSNVPIVEFPAITQHSVRSPQFPNKLLFALYRRHCQNAGDIYGRPFNYQIPIKLVKR